MKEESEDATKRIRSLLIIAIVNSGIWAISIIALVFVIQHSPGAKGLFPILGAGTAVSTALLSILYKYR